MLKRAQVNYFTPEEYLAYEDVSQTKHEYCGGRIYDMAGSSPDHALIQANLTVALGLQLRGSPCRVFASELRISVIDIDLFTYPDLSIVCGALEFDPRSSVSVTNPSVLVEVLSRSTRANERGEKFKFYKHISSLQEYVLVDSERPHVEILRRAGRRWNIELFDGADATIVLESIACQIQMRQIYEQVSWFKG